MPTLKDYLDKDIKEFWASMPGGKSSWEQETRPVTDDIPAPPPRTWKYAMELISLPFEERQRYASDDVIRATFVRESEQDVPDEFKKRFQRK